MTFFSEVLTHHGDKDGVVTLIFFLCLRSTNKLKQLIFSVPPQKLHRTEHPCRCSHFDSCSLCDWRPLLTNLIRSGVSLKTWNLYLLLFLPHQINQNHQIILCTVCLKMINYISTWVLYTNKYFFTLTLEKKDCSYLQGAFLQWPFLSVSISSHAGKICFYSSLFKTFIDSCCQWLFVFFCRWKE